MHLSLHVGFGAKVMSISLKKVRESSNNIWGGGGEDCQYENSDLVECHHEKKIEGRHSRLLGHSQEKDEK